MDVMWDVDCQKWWETEDWPLKQLEDGKPRTLTHTQICSRSPIHITRHINKKIRARIICYDMSSPVSSGTVL